MPLDLWSHNLENESKRLQTFERTDPHAHSHLVQGSLGKMCFRGYRVTDTLSLEVPMLGLERTSCLN